jgi:tripartite-type tricarboxylate transporter receptor subunit TctC
VHRTLASRLLATIALVVLAAPSAFADADSHASAKPPLRILVGFSAGGTTDQAARLLAPYLKESLGRAVVVDNRTGASGRVAAVALKQAAPDGATVMLAPLVVTTLAPLVSTQLDYDPVRDFAPVAHVADYAIALAVNVSIPARTLAEFVAWTKASPERANYGVSAAGSLPHLFGVIVARTTGVPWVAVPYRGRAPMEADLLGGQIAAAMDALSNLIELHRAGRTRIIATSGTRRSSLLPEIPTFREQGLASIEGNGWIAMYAPAGTPKPIVDEISVAIGAALRKPEIRQRMILLGYEPTGTTPTELSAIAAADAARWGPVIRAVDFRGE